MINIPPFSSIDLKVRFRPTQQGQRTGSINFTSNAPGGTHAITLQGTGIPSGTGNLTYLRGSGGKLIDPDGETVILRSVNWYGMESIGIPQGGWSRPFRTQIVGSTIRMGMLDEIKQLGFNCIRLPICEDVSWPNFRPEYATGLWNTTYINPDLNPSLVVSNTEPKKTIDILDTFMGWCEALEIRVILDLHCLAPDDSNVLGTGGKWYTTNDPLDVGSSAGLRREPRNEQQAIDALVFLANRYKDRPVLAGIDILNEPYNCAWSRDDKTGIVGFYERAGTAISAVNPDVMLICEGIAGRVNHDPDALPLGEEVEPVDPPEEGEEPEEPEPTEERYKWDTFWGGNLSGVEITPVVMPDHTKLMYSPHEYGSFLAGMPIPPWFDPVDAVGSDYKGKLFPENMPDVWRREWGFIVEQEIAPIFVGEFGSFFRVGGDPNTGGGAGYTEQNLAYDAQWIDQIQRYFAFWNINFAYWAWNPGGDPAGLVEIDSNGNWGAAQQFKIDYIGPLLPGNITLYTILDSANSPLTDGGGSFLES